MKVGWSNCSVLLFAEQKSCCDVPGGSIMRAMSWAGPSPNGENRTLDSQDNLHP